MSCSPLIDEIEESMSLIATDLHDHEFIKMLKDAPNMVEDMNDVMMGCDNSQGLKDFSAALDKLNTALKATDGRKEEFIEHLMKNKDSALAIVEAVWKAKKQYHYGDLGMKLGEFLKISVADFETKRRYEVLEERYIKEYVQAKYFKYTPEDPAAEAKSTPLLSEQEDMYPSHWEPALQTTGYTPENFNLKKTFNEVSFFTGLANGLMRKSMTEPMSNCHTADQEVSIAISKLISDLAEKDLEGFEKALQDCPVILKAYLNSISACSLYSAELQELTTDVETVMHNIINIEAHDDAFMANIILHQKKLRSDYETAKNAWADNDAYTLGSAVGDIFKLTLLNFEDPDVTGEAILKDSFKLEGATAVASPQLLSGFALGLEQKQMEGDFSKCDYKDVKYEDQFRKVVTSLLQGTEEGIEDAVTFGQDLMQSIQDATKNCSAYSPELVQLRVDLGNIKEKLIDLPENYERFIANILLNEKKLKENADGLKDAYAKEDMMEIGKQLGNIIRTSILKLEEDDDKADLKWQ